MDAGDCLVVNETRVFPARLLGTKDKTDAKVEIFLLRELENNLWEVLVKPARKVRVGNKLSINNILECDVIDNNPRPNKLLLKNGIIYQFLGIRPKGEEKNFQGEITASGKGTLTIKTSTCLRPPDPMCKSRPFTHSIKKVIGVFELTEKPSTFRFDSILAPYEIGYIYISAKGEALINDISGVITKRK